MPRFRTSRLRRPVLGSVALGILVTGSLGAASQAAGRTRSVDPLLRAAVQNGEQTDPVAPRPPGTQDRYALANGCFRLRAGSGYLTRAGSGFAATGTAASATPLHFQAIDLGSYLLFADRSDFVASASDPLPGGGRQAADVAQGYVRGLGDQNEKAVKDAVNGAVDSAVAAEDQASRPARDTVRGDGIVAAAAPSAAAEWIVQQVGASFVLQQAYDDGDPANPGPDDQPIAATLTADDAGVLHAAPGPLTSAAAQFAVEPAAGCAAWPEAQDDVQGTPVHGTTPYEQTQGYLDAHLHGMAFEFLGGRAHCGRPWHPYGITYALVDCPDHQPGGYGAALEDVVSGHTPGQGHDTVGWPTFGYWPRYDSLTHEAVYWKWLERAWQGGLRMYTNLLVENAALCKAYPLKKNSCNEMDSVRLQAQRLHELERYIDAQYGGPGRGWFRIVTDPFQARRVVNAGRLAVVMGIEVSTPLDCGQIGTTPTCTADQIDARMREVYDLGVRQMEMTNKFDNALTGVTGDSGSTGLVVNEGNFSETGHFWKFGRCRTPNAEVQHDHTQDNAPDESGGRVPRDGLFGAILETTGTSGAAPVYPAGPQCNIQGLTDLGKVFLEAMRKRGMVFDPDHMSASARQEALDVMQRAGYSGVISSHTWGDDANYAQVLRMGGVVTPHAGNATGFVQAWRVLRREADPRFPYGIGWGSDIEGFSAQGAPRRPAAGQGVSYPFTGLGGVRLDRERTGQRTWDINTDGVDSYGEYPDWVEDGRLVAGADGEQFVHDLARGAEAYLQMWERATGIAGDACRPDVPDLSPADVARVAKGSTPEQVLLALGQPHARVGTTFTYCTTGGDRTVRFDAQGRR